MHITIRGVEYPLASTLRVAYKVQGQHNHAPYSKVFSSIGDMPLEEQIGILFAAFQVANPDVAINQNQFLDVYLDSYDLKTLMDQVQAVIQGIMGMEQSWTCSCGTSVTTRYCPTCGQKNPDFVEPATESEQGN